MTPSFVMMTSPCPPTSIVSSPLGPSVPSTAAQIALTAPALLSNVA
ncbi:hypothetical protein [Paenibacillus radicibacter]|nr:hypothetical protein [Paenibacillus radicibacter]